jgi:hypothetical protein
MKIAREPNAVHVESSGRVKGPHPPCDKNSTVWVDRQSVPTSRSIDETC